MNTFDVSIETIRRDLTILEKNGKIEKVYGGAKIKDLLYIEPAMENRMVTNLPQKECIAKKCCEFINDGDCIFIDCGTTPYYISKFLKSKNNLTVVTDSLTVVNELIHTDFDVIIIGGMVRKSEHSIVSFDYLFDFSILSIQKCFLCAGGLTADHGLSDYNMQDVVTRKIIIERSKEVFVAADSSKFGRDVTINVAPISKIDYIVTDSGLSKAMASSYKNQEVRLIIAE